MKIAIVGAGISGLSLYLHLEKHGITQESVETRNASVIGASLGLSTAGLKVLKRLSEDLYQEIMDTGHILHRCRISTARGWTLANVPVGDQDELMLMIGRQAFWRCLKKRVPDKVIWTRRVKEVQAHPEVTQQTLKFDDDSELCVDLVVGADGIWSAVRKAILGGDEGGTYKYSPQYEGLVGVGGFVAATKLIDVPEGEMNVVFGGNGFFGYSYTESLPSEASANETSAVWWSTYSLDACPTDWRHIDRKDVKAQLLRRHSGWRNETIRNIIENVEVGSLYPTFVTPLLPAWHHNGCVLIGDAAHALQPSSGLGASMALEDCETLALLLRHFLSIDSQTGHQTAVHVYSQIRMPRLEMVHRKAQELGSMKQDMNFLQEMVMYFFIWLINALNLSRSYQRRVNDYDVPTAVDEHVKLMTQT